MAGRKAIPVYVNGEKHRSTHDAVATTGGSVCGMRKALSLGLKFRGFTVSREPPTQEVIVPKHYPGLALLRHPQVTP